MGDSPVPHAARETAPAARPSGVPRIAHACTAHATADDARAALRLEGADKVGF